MVCLLVVISDVTIGVTVDITIGVTAGVTITASVTIDSKLILPSASPNDDQ